MSASCTDRLLMNVLYKASKDNNTQDGLIDSIKEYIKCRIIDINSEIIDLNELMNYYELLLSDIEKLEVK